MSSLHHGGLHGVPWQDLNVRFMNDKTPPGWLLGCDLDLDKYEALCDDWRKVQSYGELLDENKNTRIPRSSLRLQ